LVALLIGVSQRENQAPGNESWDAPGIKELLISR